ncbi:hypothetical protein [Kitasatospora sp. MAP5-34]|uniref:hypothetical protein n=1 Tax=Kitasatospora sp. MAP5-34 TaxID=3035102 RepID=UPI002475BD9C|nr:hypothetical protein [Kitasatospora sp. MAP5-34]MDH6576727.1 hypothetical protein [Kitasatospora sp. MAP5-34]
MTVAPTPPPDLRPDASAAGLGVDGGGSPGAVLLSSDRVEVPRPAGLAALGRLDRLGRPYGPVVGYGAVTAFLLAPGAAETVPDLLRWLGWGAELPLGLTARPAVAGTAGQVPRARGAEDEPPRPEWRVAAASAVWLRQRETGPGLDLRSPDLLRLLDCLADACARDLMGLAPAS